mmetsp:Transcript_9200/g.16836  ORF Transcript_9200/g.16836 Transcript_9200/m.16836 type:complete len:437 (-) Transcript_9200:766-2076(-)
MSATSCVCVVCVCVCMCVCVCVLYACVCVYVSVLKHHNDAAQTQIFRADCKLLVLLSGFLALAFPLLLLSMNLADFFITACTSAELKSLITSCDPFFAAFFESLSTALYKRLRFCSERALSLWALLASSMRVFPFASRRMRCFFSFWKFSSVCSLDATSLWMDVSSSCILVSLVLLSETADSLLSLNSSILSFILRTSLSLCAFSRSAWLALIVSFSSWSFTMPELIFRAEQSPSSALFSASSRFQVFCSSSTLSFNSAFSSPSSLASVSSCRALITPLSTCFLVFVAAASAFSARSSADSLTILLSAIESRSNWFSFLRSSNVASTFLRVPAANLARFSYCFRSSTREASSLSIWSSKPLRSMFRAFLSALVCFFMCLSSMLSRTISSLSCAAAFSSLWILAAFSLLRALWLLRSVLRVWVRTSSFWFKSSFSSS